MMEESIGKKAEAVGAPWSVERRFRVTEVFLAVLWVWILVSLVARKEWWTDVGLALIWRSVVRVPIYLGCLRIV